MARLFLLFITVPVLEILIYIQISKITGIWFTIALIFSTGFIGAFLAKREGFQVIRSFKQALNMGQVPGNQLLEGVLVLIGAVLLLTPGLLTDLTGFALLLPFSRLLIREWLKRKLKKWIDSGQINFYIRL